MMLESLRRIKSIISAIDSQLGAKTVSLTSGVKLLRDGYSGAKGSESVPAAGTSHGVQVGSINRIRAVLDRANQCTGHSDSTLTDAVQRLSAGYDTSVPLYSFGLLADLHIQYNTGRTDFQRALEYLRERVPFVCVCGDLVSYATKENMDEYARFVSAFSDGMPVYECAGNHETYDYTGEKVVSKALTGEMLDRWTAATGKYTCYTREYGNDMFIFLSLKSENGNDLFVDGGLDWLAHTLDANRNKRCFVFAHAPEAADRSADPSGIWPSLMEGTSGRAFVHLIKQYKNVVWFHGHTHVTLGAETYPISEDCGYRSVHIPSLVSPRFYIPEISSTLVDSYTNAHGETFWGSSLSEGYIADVYADRIVLHGINFAGGTDNTAVVPMLDEIYMLDTAV